jgi:hypothetical protein
LVDAGDTERIAPEMFLRSGVTDDTMAAWMAVSVRRPKGDDLPAVCAGIA